MKLRSKLAETVADAINGAWHHHWHWPTDSQGRWTTNSSAFWTLVLKQAKQREAGHRERMKRVQEVLPSIKEALRDCLKEEEERGEEKQL